MNAKLKQLLLPFLAVAYISVNGCATYNNFTPAPTQQAQTNIVSDPNELSGAGDLPVGALKLDDAPLVISGHQGDNSGAMKFGLIGALIADSSGEGEAAKRIEKVKEKLRIGIEATFEETVAAAIKAGNYSSNFSLAGQKKNVPTLRVTPLLLISYVDDINVRPYVVLKLGLYDSTGSRIWSTRYFASSGKALPLEGNNSWTANNNAAIRGDVKASMHRAVSVMLKDMTTAFPRNENSMISIEDHFPYLRQTFKVVGYKLAEGGGYVVFAPKISDASVFSGINVINAETAKLKTATKDEPVISIVKQ